MGAPCSWADKSELLLCQHIPIRVGLTAIYTQLTLPCPVGETLRHLVNSTPPPPPNTCDRFCPVSIRRD